MREQILEDLKQAMKNQDKEALPVIRMIKSAMQMEELNTKRPLNDEEMIMIISKNIKTRKESIIEFEKGNRVDLIESTKREIAILEKYLPEQLAIEEIEKIIEEVFQEVDPKAPSDMGKIMAKITPIVRGKADMGEISKLIKQRLARL